jgi:hypothetical protein
VGSEHPRHAPTPPATDTRGRATKVEGSEPRLDADRRSIRDRAREAHADRPSKAKSPRRSPRPYRRSQLGARAGVKGLLMRDATPLLVKLLAVLLMVVALWGMLVVPRFWWLVLGVLVVVAPLLGRAS